MHPRGTLKQSPMVQRKCNHWSLLGVLSLRVLGLLMFFAKMAALSSQDSSCNSSNHDNLVPDVSCNQVCEYDDWYKRAHCDERNLYQVPSSVGCENTRILELQDNHLTEISVNSLMGYTKLRTLDLSNNDITVICPGVFANIKHLINIVIDNNNLQELLNGTFAGTENRLVRIYLRKNNIINIHQNVFHKFKALTVIHFSYNQIKLLPPSVFNGLTWLRDITLGYNRIRHLDQFIFKDLVRLELLSLRNNKLNNLPHGLFHGLSSLREVVLSYNELVMLPSPQNLGMNSIDQFYIDNNNLSESVSILPYLQVTSERLEISNNPLSCDCAFQSIQKWYNNRSVEHSIENPITCTLGNFTYHLDDTLPLPCDHPPSDIKRNHEPTQDHTTNTIQPSTGKHLSKGQSTSEAINPTSKILSGNYHACQRLQCHQYCNEDKTDKMIFILSIYCAVCMTIFFLSWACYICCCCFKGRHTGNTP